MFKKQKIKWNKSKKSDVNLKLKGKKKEQMLAINCVEHCWNLNPTSTIKLFYVQVFELAICTSAIRHLVCPLKFSITFFVWFLLVIAVFQETKAMLMQVFEGKQGVLWQMCKWRI